MARDEQPREDLLAEARNLVERTSLRLRSPRESAEIVAGFRRDGSLAIYFGQERVYQFTSAGALRRAYLGGLLYKAEGGRLITLRRERTPDAVNLVSTPLDEVSMAEFLRQMQAHLGALLTALARGEYELIGEVPPGARVSQRVLTWLRTHAGQITIASSPRSA